MKKEKIVNIIGYSLMVVLLLIIFIYQKNNKVIVFSAACFSLVYGITSVIKKNNYGFLFISLGVCLGLSGSFYFTGFFDLAKSFTFMISSSVFLVLLVTLIFYIIKNKKIEKEYPIVVEATVEELVSNPNTEAKFFQPLYSYVYKNEKYSVLYPEFIEKNVPSIGDKRMIRLNKDDIQDVYFEKTIMAKVYDYVFLIAFILIAVVIMVGQFK